MSGTESTMEVGQIYEDEWKRYFIITKISGYMGTTRVRLLWEDGETTIRGFSESTPKLQGRLVGFGNAFGWVPYPKEEIARLEAELHRVNMELGALQTQAVSPPVIAVGGEKYPRGWHPNDEKQG